MIGKAALDNPDLPIDFVRDLMIAKGEGKSLATPFVTDRLMDPNRDHLMDPVWDRLMAPF